MVLKGRLGKLWALSRRIQKIWWQLRYSAVVLIQSSLTSASAALPKSQMTKMRAKTSLQETWRGTFYKGVQPLGLNRIDGNGFKMKEVWFKSHIRKEFLTVRVVR